MESETSPLTSHFSPLTPRIFRALAAATTVGLLACASAPINGAKTPAPTTGDPNRAYALSQVYLLQMSDPPVADTTVRVRRGAPRVILLRHAAPDRLTFAELRLPAGAFDTTTTDSVDIAIRPRPGFYGVDLSTSAPLKSAVLTFKYAVHFKAPGDARVTFGSDVAFERVLAIGKLGPGESIVFQRSSRPAADNLSAPLTSAGSYVVGAPK
jgi:hypothetical protein